MTDLASLVKRNRGGETTAIVSVCTAQHDALRASLMLARDRRRAIVVEATSNQSNQFGGYTGLVPKAFAGFVRKMMRDIGTPAHLVQFGGDHLGPQAWKNEPADTAMDKAAGMVRAYVEAGFTKIHLDCSEGCAGEPAHLDDATVAERAVRLAAVCEQYAPDPQALVYVVGTEVPVPGGATLGEETGPVPTDAAAARQTLAVHEAAFRKAGLAKAWDKIAGLVVQPGLEFEADTIHRFSNNTPTTLGKALDAYPGIAFEAHSTDYQHADVFAELARRHFAFLKVGPALTFAYRQSLYGLDAVRLRYDPDARRLPCIMEALMRADPRYWRSHYAPDADHLSDLLHFSYADRIRYYWARPEARDAVAALLKSLPSQRPIEPVLRQFFCDETVARARALQQAGMVWSQSLIIAGIQRALDPYLI